MEGRVLAPPEILYAGVSIQSINSSQLFKHEVNPGSIKQPPWSVDIINTSLIH